MIIVFTFSNYTVSFCSWIQDFHNLFDTLTSDEGLISNRKKIKKILMNKTGSYFWNWQEGVEIFVSLFLKELFTEIIWHTENSRLVLAKLITVYLRYWNG